MLRATFVFPCIIATVACGGRAHPAASRPEWYAQPDPEDIYSDLPQSGTIWDPRTTRDRWHTTGTHLFTADNRCSTGPFVVDLPPASTRWARRIVVRLLHPDMIGGTLAIYADGRRVFQIHDDAHGMSRRCRGQVAPAAPIAAGASDGGGQSPAGPPGDGTGGADPGPPAPTTGAPPSVPVRHLRRIPDDGHLRQAGFTFKVVAYPRERVSVPRSQHAAVHIPDGAHISVVIWSRASWDLQDAVFAVLDQQLEADLPDEDFARQLRERTAADDLHYQQMLQDCRTGRGLCAPRLAAIDPPPPAQREVRP
ncbi:MAG TPA: hypothetical protein VL172_06615, partial [Kofleriaceae bacterium]|nr:hypothetical protein [Kofleriaceae bacterium]